MTAALSIVIRRIARVASLTMLCLAGLAQAQFPGGPPPFLQAPEAFTRATPLPRVDPTQRRRETGLPFVQTFDRHDYRGHSQVWCGTADARGLLYFGNYAQVLVYDGVRWENIPVPGGTFIRSLALDAQGRLWVGGDSAIGYIDTTSPVPPVFVSLHDRLPAAARNPGDITLVLPFDDSVYFQSHNWLLRWRNDAFEGWPLPAMGPPSRAMIVENELVVQHTLQGWRHIGPRGLEPVAKPMPMLPPTRFALPRPDLQWLYGTIFNGLFTFDGRTRTPVNTEADEYLRSNFLFNVVPLRDGRLGLVLLTGGVVILDADLSFSALIDDASGLPSRTVNNGFTDAHGGLWLCLGEGVARVPDTFAATWFRPPTPFGRIESNAFTRFHGRLFLGVAPELRSLEPPIKGVGVAHWEVVTAFGRGQGARFNALLSADDTLLIASTEGCFTWKENQTAVRLLQREGCLALAASASQPGRYFVGHAKGIESLRHTAEKWTVEGPLPGLSQSVRSLHEDRDGTLWAGLDDGRIARFTAVSTATPVVEYFDQAQGLPATTVASDVSIVSAGSAPLFVTAGGLRRFDAAKKLFVPEPGYGARFADGSTRLTALAENARGDLWIAPQPAGERQPGAEMSLGRATRNGEWFPLADADLGRIGDIVGLHLEIAAGREILWAIGVSGIVRVELDALRPTPPIGATQIRAIMQLGDLPPLPRGGPEPKLPYAKNSLRFRLAAPGLVALDGVEFETELAGLGRGARHLSDFAEREFTNLPEGRYVFRARATAGGREWTAPAEFAFTILPPWWRTPWAYTLWVTLTAGGVAGIVMLRTRALRHRNTRLEDTVAKRTEELQASNRELRRLHQLELDEKTSALLAEEKARLEMLRYQLNPHFLFNTLNSLYGLVAEHPAASRMVIGLSEFCRLTLTRGDEHVQTLGQELQMLEVYLGIEKVRWGDSLRTEITAPDEARAVRLPAFLLLPLVENAIKHGGETSRALLEVRITARLAEGGVLEVEISNTGHWLPPGSSRAASTGTGLENLRQRLSRYYPGAHEFTHDSRDNWVTVKLRITSPTPRNDSSSPHPPVAPPSSP